MAEVVAIKIEVDGGKSVSELTDLDKKVNKLTESFNELEEAQQEQSDSLQTNVENSKQEIDSLTEKHESSINSSKEVAKGMTNGYTAFLGVSAMVGTDQEALIRTFIKLQSVQKTTNAVIKFSNDLKKESTFRQGLDNIATKVGTVSKKAYAFAVGTGTKAMKLFRLALISTGLGALVVLLGVIIAKWDDWKDSIMKIINVAFAPFIKVLQYLGVIESDLEKQRREDAENQINRLQKESDKLDEVTSKESKRLNNELQVAKARGDNTRKLEEQLIRAERKGAYERLVIAQKLYASKLQLDEDLSDEEKQKIQDKIDQEQKAFEDSTQQLKIFNAQEEKIQSDIQAKKDADAKARGIQAERKREQEKEKERQLQEQKDAKDLELLREFEDLKLEQIADADERAVEQLKLKQEREIEDFKKSKLFTLELEKEIEKNNALELANLKEEQRIAKEEKEEAQRLEDEETAKANRDEINSILTQFDLDSIENTFERARKELEIQRKADLKRLRLAKATEEEINKVKNLYSEKNKYLVKEEADFNKEIKKAELNSALTVTAKAFDFIASESKKGSAIQKASAIASTIINTYKGAMSSYADTPGGPIIKGVASSIAVATGIASVRKIIATPLPQGGGGGGGTGISPPSFNNQTTTQNGNSSNTENGTGNGTATGYIPTTKVVLVESELEAMQGRVKQVQQIATI